MSTVKVAGVEVSPQHWIGGERVGSGETFPVMSPAVRKGLFERGET